VPTTRGGGVSTFDESGSGEQVYLTRWQLRNFENDNALRRLGDRNKPLYKPEFWPRSGERCPGNDLDPEFKCRPYGCQDGGASQIVQTKDLIVSSTPADSPPKPFRVIPTDGRPHNQARVTQETGEAIQLDTGMAIPSSSTPSDLRTIAGSTNRVTSTASNSAHRACHTQRQYTALGDDGGGSEVLMEHGR